MALESGTRLGHYEITEQLGKGGMGEVYRARDTKLGREVAIKVLPSEFAQDAKRLTRLEREARMLAALNHPNIAAIHGLEEHDGTRFLVLELVEGETLADRLKQGAIPADESLKLALQIAEALEAAHEKGVIHRDLKPANVKITPESRVKVLDFGLAKTLVSEQTDASLSNSPTLSMQATQAGVVLGTAAYMSPEQAEGETADARSDIWSFGVVLFEMLTGRRTFEGQTVPRILAAVLNSAPDWPCLPPNLHPRVRALLDRLLEKEHRDRLSSISDARVEIQRILADPAGILVQSGPAPSRLPVWTWAAALVLVAALAGLGGWLLKPDASTEPGPVRRWAYDVPEEIVGAGGVMVDVAPDDEYFVFSSGQGLHIRYMDELNARLIPGSEGAELQPMVSPDSQEIAFARFPRPWKIAVGGGQPTPLVPEVTMRPEGMSWDSEGLLMAQTGGIFGLPSNGGTPELLIEAEGGDRFFGPRRLPEGKGILFTEAPGGDWGNARIVVQAPGTESDRKVVVPLGLDARYVTSGHLTYAWEGNLYGVAFDVDSLETTGSPELLEEGLTAPESGNANYAVSRRGTLVYVTGPAGSATPPLKLVWVDREGNEEDLPLAPRTYRMPRISPDGTRLAYVVSETDSGGVWVSDLTRNPPTMTRLIDGNDGGWYPTWTQDGERIVFVSDREGTTAATLFSRSADGTGPVESLNIDLPDDTAVLVPGSWSPDGLLASVLVRTGGRDFNEDIALVSLGDPELTFLFESDAIEREPAISPRGGWIAYVSDRDGPLNVYVERFPGGGGRIQISTEGGRSPLWSGEGELFYRRLSDGAVMVVAFGSEERFEPRDVSVLIEGDYRVGSNVRDYDYDSENQRLLMIKEATVSDSTPVETDGAPGRTRIRVVENFVEELKERVPVP